MDYTKVTFTLKPYSSDVSDIMIALLGDCGFESFVETDFGFEAYIQSHLFDEETIKTLHIPFIETEFNYAIEIIADCNWNEYWEKNYFSPIVINNQCVVRSPFHKNYPEVEYQIVIEPKMAFGTGHHETTSMMIEHILEMDMKNKEVLDMGCGTGILGILASMRGASKITGIDIDKWCTENSEENCRLNGITNMDIMLGDASLLSSNKKFDIILANINRNILLEDIPKYKKVLKPDGVLMLSGFYNHDLEKIDKIAQLNKMYLKNKKENNQWVAVTYI